MVRSPVNSYQNGTRRTWPATLWSLGRICGRTVGCVQLNEDSIFVGAPRFAERGAVLVYRREGSQWRVDQIVKGLSDQENHFGAFMSLDRDNLVVGRVPHYDPAGFKAVGTANVYRLQNSKWEHFQVLKTPEPFPQQYTGTVVAAKDDTVFYLSCENKGADAVYAFELQ